MSTEADNHRRWSDGQAGYEVWYITWNHTPTGQGFWLRFVTEASHDGHAYGELWFARFDPSNSARTFGVHRRFPMAQFAATRDPFELVLHGCRLGHDHAFGQLVGDGHDVKFDLRWLPASSTLRFLPDAMYARGGLGETTVHSPNPRVPLSGTLVIDGEELRFDRAIAGQTHVWGKKHAFAWAWAHCAELDGAPDGVLELISTRLQRRGVTLPTLTLVSLDLDGERHRFNQFRHVVRNRGQWTGDRVAFSAWSPMIRLEAELWCRPEDMVAAPYVDPDGTELWCSNTEIGNARIAVYRRAGLRWHQHRVLESRGRAHFEIGSRTRDPAVAREHVLVE